MPASSGFGGSQALRGIVVVMVSVEVIVNVVEVVIDRVAVVLLVVIALVTETSVVETVAVTARGTVVDVAVTLVPEHSGHSTHVAQLHSWLQGM